MKDSVQRVLDPLTSVNRLLDHYATDTDAPSPLWRQNLVYLCAFHLIPEDELCDTFSLQLACRFVEDKIDASSAEIAMEDLLDAADFELPRFAHEVLGLFEYQESSPSDVRAFLEEKGYAGKA